MFVLYIEILILILITNIILDDLYYFSQILINYMIKLSNYIV